MKNICTPNSIGFSTICSFNSLKLCLIWSNRCDSKWLKVRNIELDVKANRLKTHYTHINVMCFCCLKYVHVNCFEIAIANEITIATKKKQQIHCTSFPMTLQYTYIYSSAETIDTIFFAGDEIDCDSPFVASHFRTLCTSESA